MPPEPVTEFPCQRCRIQPRVAPGLWCVDCRVAVQVAAGIPRKQRSDAKRKRPQIITAKSLVTVTASKTTV